MKVGIISRTADKNLIDFLSTKFETIFIPIEEIKFKIERELEVKFKNLNLLDLDYALILPNGSKEIFYLLLRAIEKSVSTPIPSENLLILLNKPLLFNFLTKNEIKTKKIFGIAQNVVIQEILERVKLPLILNLPKGKRILVKKRSSLVDILSLFKPGYMITIEKPLKNGFEAFVAQNFVICIKKDDEKFLKVGKDIREELIKIKNLLSLDFCTIDFYLTGKNILVENVKISYSPKILKKTEKNLEFLARAIEEKIKKEREGIISKINEIFYKILKTVRK